MMKLKRSLYERLKLAMGQDPKIAVKRSDLHNALGHSADYIISLGLLLPDLKRLERVGFAIRGRLPTKTGYQVRWVLIRPEGS